MKQKRPESQDSSQRDSENFNATQLTMMQKPKLHNNSKINQDILFETKEKSYRATNYKLNRDPNQVIDKNFSAPNLELTMQAKSELRNNV